MPKKRAKVSRNPVLSIAGFCLKALDGVDNNMSGITFLDHYTAAVAGDRGPEDKVLISLWALFAFKSRTFAPGELTGNHSLKLLLRSPKRKISTVGELPLGPVPETATGFNVRVKLNIKVKTPGLWWMHVLLDGRRYAKMPLRITFRPVSGAPVQDQE